MTIAEVTIIPVGTCESSLSKNIARSVDVLEHQQEVSYKVTPMGTVIEGDLDKVLNVVREMHEREFDGGIQRVFTSITIDDRRDKATGMDERVRSVESKLHRS